MMIYHWISDASNELPMENAPTMIGLHENANILYNIEKANYIWRSLAQTHATERGIRRWSLRSFGANVKSPQSFLS